MKFRAVLAVGVALSALSTTAYAQDAAPAADGEPVLVEEVIIVTGVARAQNRLESSVSLSVVDAESIADLNPRSSADLIRQIPGIRSEASGGEGNANIAVRGIPVSTGGARYIQLQEDGLPVLEFGDIIFGNSDNFIRADRNVGRVEAVRGGSASTFASNSPGGIVNFVSKTGQQQGGAVVGSIGLDHETYRLDFDYGAPLGDDTYFHVGGFYRTGEGPRDIGYNGSNGGQIRANLTQEFDGGYIRFFGKYLDDKTPAILPQPVFVGGSNSDPDYQAIDNFDPRDDSLYSRYINNVVTLDGGNNPAVYDFHDGLSVKSKAFGVEAEIEFAPGWTATNRFRYSDNSGAFLSPFPASAGDAQDIADAIGGAGSTIVFATGPNAGQTATPSTIGGNGLLTNIVNFNTRLNDLGLIANDLRISRDFDVGGGALSFTGGFYASRQNVDTDWLWTSHVQTIEGDGNSVLVDIVDANGDTVTQNGVVGYSASFFGNCCRRSYDVRYDTYAPFASLAFESGALTLDASIRYDYGSADGSITGSDSGYGNGITSFDFDNDGTISPAEASTAVLPLGNSRPVNYDFDYFSFSLGANYLLTDDLSVFARYSQGGRHTADRSLFSPAVSTLDGSLPGGDDSGVIAEVDQLEGGVKYQGGGLRLYGTAFYAKTAETNVEIAPLQLTDNKYEAFGLELEGSYSFGPFSVSGGATYTDSEIVDALNAAVIGNTPRRQADFVYQGTAQYEDDFLTAGLNLIGTTESFTQDNNELVLPAYTQVNAFLAFRPLERLEVSLNANNLFDEFGYTEAEEGSIPGNGIVRARSIAGRTLTASVRIDF
ncbi:TonB-dependent receptor [Qipengyuania gelatinilytica]|uniref:TonB-dependent receptor n=1 Tax=Qipengyuania gelatinilytica TaxID=2867231 RepID=A0ABX9A8H8_9SPHN|nr:TonB-dependent receptor [Qipengyuania gelatinilytica]QZD96208.1 TonB-dependent receptor [Qipengyuania gelatinilytica]